MCAWFPAAVQAPRPTWHYCWTPETKIEQQNLMICLLLQYTIQPINNQEDCFNNEQGVVIGVEQPYVHGSQQQY